MKKLNRATIVVLKCFKTQFDKIHFQSYFLGYL